MTRRERNAHVLEVIGTGFGRTGTLSLKHALERLGFGPCHHMLEVLDDPEQIALWTRVARGEAPDWDRIYRAYRATADWPGVRYWRELTGHFPRAKVILTVRDPRRWYQSAAETIHRSATIPEPADPVLAGLRQIVRRVVWDGEFGGRFDDPEHAIAVFDEHNAAVRREIPDDRLLVMEIGQGWEPLCDFLGVPVPADPFPRSNDRREFADRFDERLTGS